MSDTAVDAVSTRDSTFPVNQRRCVDGVLKSEPPPGWGEMQLHVGDTVIATSAAGAGYGPPWERPVDRVVWDVEEGYVSVEQARDLYGVVLTESGGLDAHATPARREELARHRPAPPPILEIDAEHLALARSLAEYVKALG